MTAIPISIPVPIPVPMFDEMPDASVNAGEALPWTIIGSALAAMAALYFSSDRFVGLPVLAVLLVFSRFSSWRLPNYFLINYGLRGLILAVVLTLINRTDTQDLTVWYLKQADTNLAGYAVAADIVLRAWQRRTPSAAREGLGVVVLMTALLFAAATNTYERLHIQLITPFYAVLLLLALRSFTLMYQPAETVQTRRGSLVLARGCVMIFALSFAFAGVYAVTRYEYQVTNWAMQFVRQHHGEQHDIGFSAAPRLTTVFDPEPSSSRVLLIDGQISEPHLRIAAFDTYHGQQWLPRIMDRSFDPLPAKTLPTNPNLHLLKFDRLGDTGDLIPLPLTSAAIQSEDAMEIDSAGTIRDMRSGTLEPYQTLVSKSPTFQGTVSLKPDQASRRRLLAIPPEIDPQVIKLAIQVAGLGEPARQIFRIQEYLRSHHAYSLHFEPHGEPLNDFILNDRAAHCQYFASAVAIMARAVGVPARYVGGFYAHEPYGDGQTVVRQRDAHAWAECWIDGTGWVTVDATPSGGRPDSLFTDPSWWQRCWEKLTDLPGQIRDWVSDNTTLLKHLAALGGAIIFCVWLVRRILSLRFRSPVTTAAYPEPSAQLIDMARRFNRWMDQQGFACPPQLTWKAHLAGQKDVHSETCYTFIQMYDRARFGYRQNDLAGAQSMLERIEKTV